MRESEVMGLVESTLSNQELLNAIGLNPDGVAVILQGYRASRIPWSRVWALFVLCNWCRQNGVIL